MELFSKVYNCYYQVVHHLLLLAWEKGSISKREMDSIAKEYGFGESAFFILPKLLSGEWPFFQEGEKEQYFSKIKRPIKPPLTLLQKSWIKALLQDPRIHLFVREEIWEKLNQELKQTKPLFHWEDFYYFDRFLEGDSYEQEWYQKNFRAITEAIQQDRTIELLYEKRNNTEEKMEIVPVGLEYSGKNDKFRILGYRIQNGVAGNRYTLNLQNIHWCQVGSTMNSQHKDILEKRLLEQKKKREKNPVVIEISGERNSLERCMLHFASYEKRTEYEEETKRYLCSIYYDKKDESELLIQILSFGPVIKVLGPNSFLNQVKERLKRQQELFSKY